MIRCTALLLLALVFSLPVQAAPGAPEQVRIVSEVWEGHTQADGTGLAWDILRLIFEPAGIELAIKTVPYMRSIGLVQRGQADAWVGSYFNEVDDGVFYPREAYDADQIVALGLAEKPVPTLESLGQYRLAWMRGYEYQRYLPNLRQYREIRRREGLFGMLQLGHVDYYLDALSEVQEALQQAEQPQLYRVSVLTWLPIYLGFADNPRGRTLAAVYDQRLERLKGNGELREVFARWQQPYPFD
jgi:polar amino acid transport system substrate-binding protein